MSKGLTYQHDEAPQPTEPSDSLPRHVAQTLATAIYETAQKMGIANGDHSTLSVPQCLHLLDCMAQPADPVKKKDWNVELSSWSDEDFIRIFHERPDLANRLRKMLAEPVKEEIFSAARDAGYSFAKGADGVIRMIPLIKGEAHTYDPKKPTEQEWKILTENGRKAWGDKPTESVNIDVDDLAQEIRRVDGNNALGASALAEALMPFLKSVLQSQDREDDPLQPAANWLIQAIEGCTVGDIQAQLMIGYNRAERLFDHARRAEGGGE